MDDDVAAADGGGLAWILERKLCFLSARFPRFVALKYIFFFILFLTFFIIHLLLSNHKHLNK